MPFLSAIAAATCDLERAFAIVLSFGFILFVVSALSPATRCVLKRLEEVAQEIFLKFSREFARFETRAELDLIAR